MIYSVWEKTQSPEYGGFAYDPAWVYAANQSLLASAPEGMVNRILGAPWAGTKTDIAIGIAAIPDAGIAGGMTLMGYASRIPQVMVAQYAIVGGLIAWDYIDG